MEIRAQELGESRDGCPGLPSLIAYGFCGHKATLNQRVEITLESRRDQEEGGELDSHEEVRRFCGSRRDQEEGGGAGPFKLAQKRSRVGRWS